jgi:hypothetical protein
MLFHGVEPVFHVLEHRFLGVESVFHAQEQENVLGIRKN